MILIGIDPDVTASGYASGSLGEIEILGILPFWDLICRLERLNANCDIEVYIEAGWQNKKSNWHNYKSTNIASRVGKNVGANHQVGKLLEEFCKVNDIRYHLVRPISNKVDRATFEKLTGGKFPKTNQEERDAGMLILRRK